MNYINRHFYVFKVIFVGLMISQVLSTIGVYKSNTELLERVEAIIYAGYLAVPNSYVMDSLGTFTSAFLGGLFFTLTVGICLTFLSFGAVWAWDRIFFRNSCFFLCFMIAWLWCVCEINSQGFSKIPSAFFLLIPVIVASLTRLWLPDPPEKMPLKLMVHFISLMILMVIGAKSNLMNDQIFLKTRDNLLLSNPVGIKLNDFYYKYTLYAARLFKSQNQKLIKTCSLALIDDMALRERIEKILLNHDYLILERGEPTDLDIIKIRGRLIFKIQVWTILETTPGEFLRSPREILKMFSERSDKYVFFRKFTFLSLLLVPSVTLYVGIYVVFRILSGFFMKPASASVLAGIFCFIIGLSLLLSLRFDTEEYIETTELADYLESDNWHRRVAALKTIRKRRIDISKFPSYTKIMESPHIPERYWLARAMGGSRSPKVYYDILKLLDDPNFNVVYSAFYALGQRGEKKAVGKILRRIRTSDNWYVQWYAYKALRKLRWKQRKGIEN